MLHKVLREWLFALRLCWRQWRSGEVKILILAMALAVSVVTAIAVFTDRMDQSLLRQSNSFLAADRVVESRFTFPETWAEEAEAAGLKQANIAQFASMVFAENNNSEAAEDGPLMQLANIKAVSDGYPLRGRLEISNEAFAQNEAITIAEGIPKAGEVWVDSRLLPLLNIDLGDAITIGNQRFIANKVIIREPDTASGFSALGPRVLMNLRDLESTGVILPGSRVDYRWLLAGDENTLNNFVDSWLEQELGEHYRLISLQDTQQNIGSALDRGSQFLLLAAIIGVLLAGVAISIASQQFANRHVDQVALLKSLGASKQKIRRLYSVQLLILGTLASLLGIIIGEGLQRGISLTLASFLSVELLPARGWTYGLGFLSGLICLLGFVLPPLWHLPTVPPLKVLRRELTISSVQTWLKGSLGLLAICSLMWFYSGNAKLTLSVLLGLLVLVVLCFFLALLLLRGGQQFGSRAGSVWRLAVANLRRYQQQSVTQILVFACALMLLLVLFSVRTSFIDQWRLQLPEDAPNHFILNIAPYEREPLEQLLADNQFTGSPMYPMILGRLTHNNDVEYGEEDRVLSNALRRELNLSWSATLATDNTIITGEWWDAWQPKNNAIGVSVEQDTAEELSLDIGDVLTFSLGGLSLKAEVASIRTVDWTAMTPNFYFLFSPGALDNYSPNYLTSVYIPAEQKRFVNTLLRDYPTMVVLEIDRIIERIRTIVNQVSRAIELVLWIVLLGGVLVLIAAVNASMANRLQEAGVLRALGSRRRLIAGSIWCEFTLLGLLAGLLAVIGTEALLLSLQFFVFDQSLQPHFSLWLIGPLVGALLVGVLGYLSCQRVLRVPPGVVLRELNA